MGTVYKARTDDEIVQPLIPPPDMGNALGVNKVFVDARFNNVRILRATDVSYNVNGASFTTADSGEPCLFSKDSSHFLVRTPGGQRQIIAFNKATFQVSNTGLLVDGAVFSWKDPLKLFSLVGTELHQIMVKPDWSGIASNTILFDFKTVLGSSFQTWSGSFLPKRDDKTFVIAFSDSGGQGSGHHLAVYRIGRGWRLYDTAAGTITGNWGAKGSVDDGTAPLADRFTMHEGGGGQNPAFAMVSYSQNQPGGTSGCLAGNCAFNTPYMWEIASLHVRPCGGHKCDGHSAKGFLHTATGKRYILHNYSDPTTPLTALLASGNPFCDMHGAWANSGTLDANPLFAVTTKVNPPDQNYLGAAYNEVIAVASDGSGKRYRFGQTLNSGNSRYFVGQNAIGVVDQSGHYVLFTSDWEQTLGLEKDGKTIRCDCFIMEAR